MHIDTDDSSVETGRRTLLKGAAWSVPVIATAAAAPMAVASARCTSVQFREANWVNVHNSGSFRPGAVNSWQNVADGPQRRGWMSEADNDSTTGASSYWLYQEFTAYPQFSYTITYQVAGKYAPSNYGSSKQTVEVQAGVNGTVIGQKTFTADWSRAAHNAGTRPAAGVTLADGSITLPLWSAVPTSPAAWRTVTPRTETINIGPGVSGTVRFQFYFVLSPRFGAAYPDYGTSDIFVNAEVVCR